MSISRNMINALMHKISQTKNLDNLALAKVNLLFSKLSSKTVTPSSLEILFQKNKHACLDKHPYLMSCMFQSTKNLNRDIVPQKYRNLLETRLLSTAMQLDARDLCFVLASLENWTPEQISPQLRSFLIKQLENLPETIPAEMSAPVLKSLQNHPHSKLLRQTLKKIGLKELAPDEFASSFRYLRMIEFFSFLQKNKPVPHYIRKKIRKAHKDLAQVYKKLRSMDRAEKEEQVKDLTIMVQEKYRHTEKVARGELRRKFPGEDIRFGRYIDGIETDIYLPKFKINIELDGKAHLQKLWIDNRRDQYLEERHGISVIRIKTRKGWLDELVGIVDALRNPPLKKAI